MAQIGVAEWRPGGYHIKGVGMALRSGLSHGLLDLHDAKENVVDVEFERSAGTFTARMVGESTTRQDSRRGRNSGRGNDRHNNRRGGPERAGRERPGRQQNGGRGSNQNPNVDAYRRSFEPAFRNPYNFFPFRDRDVNDAVFGDHPPAGQERYQEGLISGRIDLVLTVVTPLVINDAVVAIDEHQHKATAARRAADGAAMIPPASLRGALSAAYEAVTNSRLRQFDDHAKRLGYRVPAQQNAEVFPCRVVHADGAWFADLYEGHAWIEFYHRRDKGGRLTQLGQKLKGQHGEPVTVDVAKHAYKRPNGTTFPVDVVTSITVGGTRHETRRIQMSKLQSPPVSNTTDLEGVLHITGDNFARKHDERVFFRTPGARRLMPIADSALEGWKLLIGEYRALAADRVAREERNRGRKTHGVATAQPGAHARTPKHGPDQWAPADGMTAYAECHDGKVVALSPTLISREIQPLAPKALLPQSLRPAARLSELSPADRLFGFVPDGSASGDRYPMQGLIRMTGIRQRGDIGVVSVRADGQPLSLPILSTPKVQQGRFYVGRKDQAGWSTSAGDGRDKRAVGYGNVDKQALRGRKTYPHQQRFNLASLPRSEPSDQNYSVASWVAPGTGFTTSIWVHNVGLEELGALLWAINPGDGAHLRLGGAKPFGFGSVTATVVGHELRDGEEMADRYRSWGSCDSRADIVDSALDAFRSASKQTFGADFGALPHIQAYLTAAIGYTDEKPSHYPRRSQQPDKDGKNYEWFMWNDRSKRFGGQDTAPQFALGDLTKDPGLPYADEVWNPR